MMSDFFVPLNKIPSGGLHFHFTPASKEWANRLQDLIGKNDYDISLSIKPLSSSLNDFQVKGRIKTCLNLSCSRCAIDFKYKIDKKITERICIRTKPTQDKEEIHVAFKIHEEEEVTILSQTTFNLSQFIRELIAIEEPMKPVGKPSCDLNDECENLISAKKEMNFMEEKESVSQSNEETHRPFVGLDKLL